MKTCLNCFYGNRNWFEIPCRTCMENDNHDNWTGIDEEESEGKNNGKYKMRTMQENYKDTQKSLL